MDSTWRELSPPRQPQDLREPRTVEFSGHAAALVFDGVALFLLSLLPGMVAGGLAELLPRALRGLPHLSMGCLLLLCTAGDIAFAASPGKWILGIVIRTAAGHRASTWRLTLRWAIKYSSALILFAAACVAEAAHWLDPGGPPIYLDGVYGLATLAAWVVVLGSLLALFPSRRTLHDRIAGTAVFIDVEHDGATRHGFEVAPAAAVLVEAEPVPAPQSSPAPPDPVS